MKCRKCSKNKSCEKCEQHINWILKDLMNFMDKYSSEDQRTTRAKIGTMSHNNIDKLMKEG